MPIIPVALQSPSGQVRRLTKLYGGLSDNKVKILTYEYNGHDGAALYQFKITEKGTYRVQVGSLPATRRRRRHRVRRVDRQRHDRRRAC